MKRLVLVLAAVLGLLTILLFLIREDVGPPDSRPAADLLPYAPADAEILAFADLAALRHSTLVQKLIAQLPVPQPDPEYQEFVRETGFDYATHLDRVLLAIRRAGSPGTTLAVAEGSLDRPRVQQYVMRKGKAVQQDGEEVFLLSEKPPARTMALRWLTDTRVAIADDASLVVRRVDTPAPSPVLDRALRLSGSSLFAVAQLPRTASGVSFGGFRINQSDEILRDIRWLTLAAQPEGGALRVEVTAECDTLAQSLKLYALLQGFRPLAQAWLDDPSTRRQLDPALLAALNQIVRHGQIDHTGQTVRLRFELTEAIVPSTAGEPRKAS